MEPRASSAAGGAVPSSSTVRPAASTRSPHTPKPSMSSSTCLPLLRPKAVICLQRPGALTRQPSSLNTRTLRASPSRLSRTRWSGCWRQGAFTSSASGRTQGGRPASQSALQTPLQTLFRRPSDACRRGVHTHTPYPPWRLKAPPRLKTRRRRRPSLASPSPPPFLAGAGNDRADHPWNRSRTASPAP